MKSAAQDIAARSPIWHALSDLYLDNEYRNFVRVAARRLAASQYTLDELREILMQEVHPVLFWNLCTTAGVWDAFDPAWLDDRILRRQRRPQWLRPRAWAGRRYAGLVWRLLEPRIKRERDRAGS